MKSGRSSQRLFDIPVPAYWFGNPPPADRRIVPSRHHPLLPGLNCTVSPRLSWFISAFTRLAGSRIPHPSRVVSRCCHHPLPIRTQLVECTMPPCLSGLNNGTPVRASHFLAVLSSEAVTTHRPIRTELGGFPLGLGGARGL